MGLRMRGSPSFSRMQIHIYSHITPPSLQVLGVQLGSLALPMVRSPLVASPEALDGWSCICSPADARLSSGKGGI